MPRTVYYSLHDLLSRGATWNFVCGARSVGKTWACKEWGIRDFIKNGAKFVYLRRYDTEHERRARFFEKIAPNFPEHEFKVKGEYGYIRPAGSDGKWSEICFFASLSRHQTYKGAEFDGYDKIFFDEFIIEDTRYYHYLSNEVHAMLSFWHTVDRGEERTRVVFCSNAARLVNPYFTAYNIGMRELHEQEFISRNGRFVCVQIYRDPEAEQIAGNSTLAALAPDGSYSDYAIKNKFMDDSDLFICPVDKGARASVALTYQNRTFVVYHNKGYQTIIALRKNPPANVQAFAMTRGDMVPNLPMIAKAGPTMRALKRLAGNAALYYEDAKCRELFYTMANVLGLW